MSEETKKCKHCQMDIPKKARVCPNCRKKQGGKLKYIIIGFAAIMIIGAVAMNSGESSNNSDNGNGVSNSNEVSSEKKKEKIEYTSYKAKELEDDLSSNALKATNKYKDKYIEVTGYLSNIDSSGNYIDIEGGSDDFSLSSIQCYIKNDDQQKVIMEMKIGDKIVVKGKCTDVGEVMGYSIDIDEVSAKKK